MLPTLPGLGLPSSNAPPILQKVHSRAPSDNSQNQLQKKVQLFTPISRPSFVGLQDYGPYYIYICVDMEVQSNCQSKDSMESVAQALMSIFSNDVDTTEDHSLSMFLLKIYKNNQSPKPKRMNSIRLTRFNAFLYRVHSNYPTFQNANTIFNHLLLAVLNNDRNFQEEQDQQIVISIGRWTCHLVLDAIQRGFYDSTYTLIKYLINQERPTLHTVAAFEELLKGQSYFNDVELSSEDESAALRGDCSSCLTSTFNLKEFILQNLNLKQIYQQLYQNATDKREIVRLFNQHIAKITPTQNPTQLFIHIFINQPNTTAREIESVFESLDESYFSHQATVRVLETLIRQQESAYIYAQLLLKDHSVDCLFLQMLNDFWRKRSIQHLVDTFLSAKTIRNNILLYLIINSESLVPKKYLLIPFNSQEIKYQHMLIFAIALAQLNDKKMPGELIELLAKIENDFPNEKKTLLFRAIHFSLAGLDKKVLYSNILTLPIIANFGSNATLSFLPIAQLKSDRLSTQQKKVLVRMLQNYNEGTDNAMKIKAELLGVCNLVNAPTRRIKELTQLMQKPFEELLKNINISTIRSDPEVIAALLMAANNKLYLTFVPEPKFDLVEALISLYIDMQHNYAKRIGALQNLEQNQSNNLYYAALFRLGMHIKRKVGTLGGQIGDLVSGQVNYRRVNGSDFADYFIGEQQKPGLIGQLWAGKKITFELRKLLENIVNFNSGSSQNRRDLRTIFEQEWVYPLAFETIRAYFQAEIQDPQALRQILPMFTPSYEFFERVQKIFNQGLDDYADILYYTADLLREVYPEMLSFLAQLVESQPARKEKEKQREKRKSSKKKRVEKEKQERRVLAEHVYNNTEHIMDNPSLFETLMKRRELKSIFGQSAKLSSFAPLTAVLLKINDQFNRLQKIVNEWLPTVCVFHCQKSEGFDQWSSKVSTFCDLWQTFLIKKKFRFANQELQKHFHILTQFLNVLYESKRQMAEFQQKILITLLLIYQASCASGQSEELQVPTESLKNFFLGYRLPTPNQQHYYHCFTCNLPICQVCLPFLHKHHDVNYLGKDGFCVHDGNKRKEEEKQPQQQQQQQVQLRDQRLRDLQRYQPIPNTNIFQASAYHSGLMRNQRREDDWLMSSFEFPDEEMDFGEHLRFKEIMEARMKERERDKDREKQKEILFSRERERMQKEEILMLFEKDKNQNNQENNEIRSTSSKSIKNLHVSHSNREYFIPQFTPNPEPPTRYHSSIDTRPLRCLLLRELNSQAGEEAQRQQRGKTTATILNQRYNFFNKSNYFKNGGRPDFGMMRGMGMAGMPTVKRSLLTSNNRFLAYPTPNNGVILMVISNILAKMTKRIQNRAFADFQQERGFLAGNINNSNFSFEPIQIQFNRNSPNLLAIIGINQLGFAFLSNEGKLQKYSDSDFKSAQPITKFVWLTRHRNIFAVATGNSIRLGHVNDEGRVKTTNRFRVHIDKMIRDFEINSEGGALFVYIVDQDGALYRAEFDYRGAKTINITDKKLNYSQKLEPLQSLLFADKKLLLTSTSGKCYMLQVQNKGNAPIFQESFDLEAALRNGDQTKFIKWPAIITQLQVLQASEHVFSVGCILKRTGGDPKRRGGFLLVLRGGSKHTFEIILLHEEETLQTFEVTDISQNSYLITAVDENGSVFCYHYQIPQELFSLREDTKIPIDENSIQICNTLVKTNNLLALAKYCEPRRYENFKESKDISNFYRITIDPFNSIKINTTDPYKFFWTGLLFTADPKNYPAQLVLDLFGKRYRFNIQKSRQIQIPLNIKETIQIFTGQGQFILSFGANNAEIKNCRIYGIEYSAESIYKRSFIHLHKLIITHMAFNPNNIEQYLENVDRHSLAPLDLSKFNELKVNLKYTTKELNLLMKLQLLRECVEQRLSQENSLEQALESVKTYLMPQCEKRHYLQKSCWKLIRRLCQLGLPLSQGLTGHPLEYRTVLDFYYFQGCYWQWSASHQLIHFQQLVNLLYALIFKRIGNLYIIFKVYPDLIFELTSFYKTLLQSLKLSKNQARDQAQLQKLVNICPNFVALVCEYYQTLKNTPSEGMIDENEEQTPQNTILTLLQEIFCATRKEIYRQVFISPEVYLEKLYLCPREPQPLDSAINIFQISSAEGPHLLHHIRPANPQQQQPPEESRSQQQQIQMDEESEKEVMLQQQAKSMEEGVQEQNSSEMQQQQPVQQRVRRIHNYLGKHLLPLGGRLNFTYYQFSFQMATALFSLEGHIHQQNAVFYIGFLFNLLRILEMNLDPIRDAAYLKDFFRAIHSKIYASKHSVLYMVLNYFFEPMYGQGQQKREVRPSQSKICREFVNYLESEHISVCSLLMQFKVAKIAATVTLGEAMKFTAFSIENHLYQLKFLGSLYFNAKLTTDSQVYNQTDWAFKYCILAGVVRHGLRILKNIMLFEGWQGELEQARVEVGFQTLQNNPTEGLNILVGCSKTYPSIFIKKLSEDPKKIETLQVLLQSHRGDSTKIIEMLTTYYSS